MKKKCRFIVYAFLLTLFFVGAMFLGFSERTFATNANIDEAEEKFTRLLTSKNIDPETIKSAPRISRLRVVELLNLMECHDCHRSSKDIVNTLTESWWNDFRTLPGKNFDDVPYNGEVSADNNYYCISYVANKTYVNGFPRGASPLCPGMFCGSLDITNADFIQAIFNIIATQIYAQYTLPRSEVSSWFQQQPQTIKNTFTLQDQRVLATTAKTCTTGSCQLASSEQLSVYAKYCRWNPESCDMNEYEQISKQLKKGSRPLSELSILVAQGIFLPSETRDLNIEDYTTGRLAFDVMSRLKMRMQCVDLNDQDQDGILDQEDNCYLTPNPSQKDLDQDGIGDVCDDDIDGDTIKNPIGIVDDEGNIVASVLLNHTGELDNCIFIQNRDQKDDDNNKIGNVCDIDEKVGLRIWPRQLTLNTFFFDSEYSGSLTDFIRYFGDSTTALGEESVHKYPRADFYNVRLEAKAPSGRQVIAYTAVTVLQQSASLLPEKLVQRVGEKVNYTIRLQNIPLNTIEFVRILRGDGRTRELRGQDILSFTDTYLKQGGYTIQGIVYTKDGRELPIGAFVTVIGGDFCMPINSDLRKGHCDMDKDGIPDLCDDDIDGDSVKNPLGLILHENATCTYDPTNTDPTDEEELAEKGFDNCPFTWNPDQKECNGSGSNGGDNGGGDGDIDGDGIKDKDDKCPTIPENMNGIEDEDGCPEDVVSYDFPDTFLKPGVCLSCPCQYAKNDASLLPGDMVKAFLFDAKTNRFITESNLYRVQ